MNRRSGAHPALWTMKRSANSGPYAYAPLTTGLLQSVAGDKLQRQQGTHLDCLYEHVVDDLDEFLSLGVHSNEDKTAICGKPAKP
jgi:hypothetical protein